MSLRILVVLGSAFALFGCPPKFAKVTFTGLPTCPNSRLSAEVMVKIEGPRISMMERVNGTQASIAGELQQGKTYAVKAYFCKTEPCETPAQLLSESTVTAPEAETGVVALGLKNLPDCVAVAPPPVPAAADGDAAAPGSPADGALGAAAPGGLSDQGRARRAGARALAVLPFAFCDAQRSAWSSHRRGRSAANTARNLARVHMRPSALAS